MMAKLMARLREEAIWVMLVALVLIIANTTGMLSFAIYHTITLLHW